MTLQLFCTFKIHSIFTFKLEQNDVAGCDNELYVWVFFSAVMLFFLLSCPKLEVSYSLAFKDPFFHNRILIPSNRKTGHLFKLLNYCVPCFLSEDCLQGGEKNQTETNKKHQLFIFKL